jgi:HSP20 family protein
MAEYQDRSESERGSIEPRRVRGVGSLWDWEPFRGFFPGNWQQSYGVDVTRRDNGYEIEVATPGFRPEDIEVTFQDGILTVSARNERRSFTRSLSIPEDVDEEGIEAKVDHGMLTLLLRLHPKRQPRRIQVKATTGQTQANRQPAQTTS